MVEDSDSSTKNILIMSMMIGGKAFSGLFGSNQQTVAIPATVKKLNEKKPARKPATKSSRNTC